MYIAVGIEPKIWRFSYFKNGCNLCEVDLIFLVPDKVSPGHVKIVSDTQVPDKKMYFLSGTNIVQD